MLNDSSLKTRFNLLIIILTVVPAFIIGVLVAWNSFQIEKEDIETYLLQTARHTAQDVDDYLALHFSQLELLVNSREILDVDSAEQRFLLSSLLTGDRAYDELRLIDASGMEVASRSRLRVRGPDDLRNFATTPEFRVPARTGQPYYSTVWFDSETNKPYMTIAVPILNLQTNAVKGVLAADIDFRVLLQVLSDEMQPEVDALYVIDSRGRIIASADESDTLHGHSTTWPSTTPKVEQGVNGNDVFRVVQPISLDTQQIGVVVERDVWHALRPGAISLGITLLVIAIAMGIALFVGRYIVATLQKPIENLVATAQRIKDGDFSVSANVDPTAPRELQQLATAFNHSNQSLTRSLKQLENTVAELEESQAALTESEERYRALFENANDSIFIADSETHRFLAVNDVAVQRLGYTREELLHMTFDMINADADLSEQLSIIEQLQSGQGVKFRRTHRRKDGTLIPVEISSRLVDTGDGQVIQSIVRDISDTIAAQQTLQDNLQFMETLLDTIPNPVFYKNTRGEYIGCNAAFAKMILGLPKAEIIGRTITELNPNIPPDLAEVYIKQDQAMFDSHGSHFYESDVLCADGVRRDFFFSKATFLNTDGDVAGIVGVMVDLSEQKQTEIKLRRANRLYAVLSQVQAATLSFENRIDLLQRVCTTLADQGRFPLVWAGLYNADNYVLEPVAVAGTQSEYLDDVQIEITPDSPSKNCPAGRAFQHGKTLTFNDIVNNPEFVKWNSRAASFGFYSAAAIPIKLENHILGAIGLYAETHSFFSVEEIKLLREIEAALSSGLARHHQQQIQNISFRVAEAAINQKDMPHLFATIHQSLEKLMPVNNIYVALYDEDTELLSFPYFVDEQEPEPPKPKKLGKGLTEYVLRSGEPLLASGDVFDTLVSRSEIESYGPSALDWIGVPLKTAERTIGVLAVQSYSMRNRYGIEELDILKFVSSQIALAIERVRDEARLLRHNRELALLNNVVAASLTAQTAEEIFQVACEALYRTFDANQVVGGVLNSDFSELEIVAESVANPVASFLGRTFYPPHDPLVKNLLLKSDPFVLDDAAHQPIMGELREGFARRHIEALVMLPVAFGEKLFGGITLFYKVPLPLNSDEIALAQRIAGQVGAVLARFQLSREQNRLLIAIEQVRDSIFITDTLGCIIYVNPHFENATGYTKEEVLGKNPRIFNSGQQSEEFYADLWQTILNGDIWQGRVVNRRKDGEHITEDMVISPIRNASGEVVNFVAVKRDVTETLKMEEQFRQSQKMEAIGQLTGGIAHDFNNLLTAINGYSEMLLRQLPNNSDIRDMAQNILGAGNRAAELTRQLLAFSRKTIIRPQVMSVNDTARNLAKMLQRIIGEDILLNFDLSGDLFPVKMDPSQVEQIILNLVVNARDAMPLGGEITIATENTYFADEEISPFAGLKPGYFVRIQVSDTGEGISPETMEHIFEPFFTTKDVGQGTGLGLATVFGIVKQNDGDIRVYSEQGDGASFSIYLPAVVDEFADEDVLVADDKHTLPVGTEFILVVDDDDDVRMMAAMALEDQGYQVQEAGSATEALSWLMATDHVPDLLITDVIMPEVSGKTLAENVRALYPELKMIFMSGYPENQISRHHILQDDLNFLQKPFMPTDLAKLVRQVLDVH